MMTPLPMAKDIDIPLDRDVFLRTLLRHLTGTLQKAVGQDEAAGFVAIFGQQISEEINDAYCKAWNIPLLSREQVAQVLIDFKARIHGGFYVISEDDEKIVLGNRQCPYSDKVLGREALCMTTSNVFGGIAAENLGYAKVEIQESIARGDAGCLVVIHLKPNHEAEAAIGREYFKA